MKKKSRKGYVLVSKNGRIYHKRVEALKEQIMNSKRSNIHKQSLVNDLEDYVLSRSINKKRLTETGFFGHLQNITYKKHGKDDRRIRTLIANLGYSPRELAKELHVKVADLLDEDNWQDDIFSANTKQYKLTFNYTGSAFEEI